MEFLTSTYAGGSILLMVGLLACLWSYHSSRLKTSLYRADLRGWIGGVGFILLGMAVIVAKLFGKI
jgi:hypothetical protein